jgi:hypothetical protein
MFSTQFDARASRRCNSKSIPFYVYSILLTKECDISYRLATNLLIESGGGKRPCEATATGHKTPGANSCRKAKMRGALCLITSPFSSDVKGFYV